MAEATRDANGRLLPMDRRLVKFERDKLASAQEIADAEFNGNLSEVLRVALDELLAKQQRRNRRRGAAV